MSSPSSNHIHRITIVGAGGQSGKHITTALLATHRFHITALTRPDSTTPLPPGLSATLRIPYTDTAALTTALSTTDCLIITMSVLAPPDTSTNLITAACAAGVPWILPNEWGADHLDPIVARESLIGESILKNRELVKKLSTENGGKTKYVAFVNSFWYEYSIAAGPATYGFDWKRREVTLFGDGEVKINTTTLPKMGEGVAALLSLPVAKEEGGEDGGGDGACLEDFKDSCCYVSSFRLTQKEMLASVERVTGEKWTVVGHEDARKRVEDGMKEMQGGSRAGFGKVLYSRFFYPDAPGDYEGKGRLHNKVLGLKEEDLDEWTRVAKGRFDELGHMFG